jgi:hypothetical protein
MEYFCVFKLKVAECEKYQHRATGRKFSISDKFAEMETSKVSTHENQHTVKSLLN